jgi:hypothetical protein
MPSSTLPRKLRLVRQEVERKSCKEPSVTLQQINLNVLILINKMQYLVPTVYPLLSFLMVVMMDIGILPSSRKSDFK